MRVLYLSHGPHVHDIRFLEAIRDAGHETHLVSYWPAPLEAEPPSGIEFTHYDARFPRLPRILAHLRALIRKTKPDVVHAGWAGVYGLYAGLTGFRAIVLTPWGSDILVEPYQSSRARRRVRYALRRAAVVACDCEYVRQHVLSLSGIAPSRTMVFPWGIDLRLFNPEVEPADIRAQLGWQNELVMVMTRNFRPVYGIEVFLSALPQVVSNCPNARALLVGSGAQEEELRDQVRRLDLEDVVHFAGAVPQKQMASMLRAADVYVTTSLSDGTSTSLLEAMACALPVVVSDCPAYHEWVDDGWNGFIAPRRDPQGVADRLIRLLQDHQLRAQMGQDNLRIARQRADWVRNFAKLEGAYRRAAGQAPACSPSGSVPLSAGQNLGSEAPAPDVEAQVVGQGSRSMLVG